MASLSAEEVPLRTLYLQIEYAQTPLAILNLPETATETDIRDSYRTIALRIHPDKIPDDGLRNLHTLLFQKIQAAYDELAQTTGGEHEDPGPIAVDKQLPETEASLHARNVAFREALRGERERALDIKHSVDARKVAKAETLKARDQGLAEKKKEKLTRKLPDPRDDEKRGNKKASLPSSPRSPPLDWEEEENRLQAAETQQRKSPLPDPRQKGRRAPDMTHPPQNKPTATSARPAWNAALDQRLVSDREIQSRWDKSLLSGGGRAVGSVSLSQKAQTSNNAAARMLKSQKPVIEDADREWKGALMGSRAVSGPAVLKGEDEAMREAFVGGEEMADEWTKRAVRLGGGNVEEEYFLED